jgi:hypothetical protein
MVKYIDKLERILTMVYVVQNFSGISPSSCIPKNTTFRKLDLFPSSGEGGGEDTYSVGPLERTNLNHWTNPGPWKTPYFIPISH